MEKRGESNKKKRETKKRIESNNEEMARVKGREKGRWGV